MNKWGLIIKASSGILTGVLLIHLFPDFPDESVLISSSRSRFFSSFSYCFFTAAQATRWVTSSSDESSLLFFGFAYSVHAWLKASR